MATKTKKTGAALPTTDEPEPNSDYGGVITDAQAADLKPSEHVPLSGFNAVPETPTGPVFPSPAVFGMGGDTTRPSEMAGDLTQPSDFAKAVAAATAVPSKGGPPTSELYASTKRGPVGPLKRPQETEQTTTPPEFRIQPTVPGWTTSPAATPSPSNAASTEQPAQGGAQATQEEEKTDYTPRSFSDEQTGPLIAAAHKAHPDYFRDSDYSTVPLSLRNDPNFAGFSPNGQPLFVDPGRNGDIYAREHLGLGHERRWYSQPFNAKEATEGTDVQDDAKAAMSRDAAQRLTSLIPSFQAIKDYQDALDKYQKVYGNIDEGQRRALVELNKTGTDIGTQISKGWSGMFGNVNPDLAKLEQLRNAAVNASTQALNKSLTNPQTAASLQTPMTLDSIDLQRSRMNTIQTSLLREFQTLRALYPYSASTLKELGTNVLRNAGIPENVDMVNPTRGLSTAPKPTSAAASSGTLTYEQAQAAPQIRTLEDIKKYPSHTLVRDLDGKLHYTP
jgi:hypothetical protein